MNPLKGKNKGNFFSRIFLQRAAAFFLDRRPAASAQGLREAARAGPALRRECCVSFITGVRAASRASGGPPRR